MSNKGRDPTPALEDEEPRMISTYTRAEAIADGTLKDVTAQAEEAGILVPTAVTRAVWNEYVELTLAAQKKGEDLDGRLWDIMWMFRSAAVARPNHRELTFQLYVVTARLQPSPVTLKAILGHGDDGEPVFTIMLPDED